MKIWGAEKNKRQVGRWVYHYYFREKHRKKTSLFQPLICLFMGSFLAAVRSTCCDEDVRLSALALLAFCLMFLHYFCSLGQTWGTHWFFSSKFPMIVLLFHNLCVYLHSICFSCTAQIFFGMQGMFAAHWKEAFELILNFPSARWNPQC